MGTSIAIVASAAYLKGKEYGNEIDSKDLVCRINQNFMLCGQHGSDIGQRTDICYLASTVYHEKLRVWNFPSGAIVRKKNGGLQNMNGIENYCMNTGIIAVIDYAIKGYDVYVYGMDFYAGLNNGKILEKPLNCGIEKPIKVKNTDVYLENYQEIIGNHDGYFYAQHVGGMQDLLTVVEYSKKYKITFDNHMKTVINNNLHENNRIS